MKHKKIENFVEKYKEVLELVKKGSTIEKACIKAKIDRSTFYFNVTKEQKQELRFHKSTIAVYGVSRAKGERRMLCMPDTSCIDYESEEDF